MGTGTEIDSENFRVDLRTFDGGLMIALAGEFDLSGVPRFERALEAVAGGSGDRLLIDFTELQFIDSAGLSAIVTVMAHQREAGRTLQACGIRGQVERILELVGIEERLETVDRPAHTEPLGE